MVGLYGQAVADAILNSAEVVTIYGVPAVDTNESERWSRAIGQFTASVETTSGSPSGKAMTSQAPQPAPLMSRDDFLMLLERVRSPLWTRGTRPVAHSGLKKGSRMRKRGSNVCLNHHCLLMLRHKLYVRLTRNSKCRSQTT
jgi:hypothetical protein